MKQKKINDKLYVFDLEPYVITNDTDAAVIYVQNHVYDAYKALNPLLNIKRYNYNVIATNKPEWYDYINASEVIVDPDEPHVTPPVDKLYPVFEYTSVSETVSINYGNSTSGSFWDGLSHPNISEGDIHFTWSNSSNLFSLEDNVYTLSSEATPGEYTVTITAIFDGNETYYPAQATKNITIYVNQQEQPKTTPSMSFNNTEVIVNGNAGSLNALSVSLSEDLNNSYSLSPINYNIIQGNEYGNLVNNSGVMSLSFNTELLQGNYEIVVEASFAGNEMYYGCEARKTIYLGVSTEATPAKSTPTVSVSVPQTLYFVGTGTSVELSYLESFISSPVAYEFVSLNTTNNASLSNKEPISVYIDGFGSPIILEYTTVETNEYAPTTFFIQFTPMQKTAASFNWKNNPLSLTGTEGLNPQIQYDLSSAIENNNNLSLTYSIKSGQGSISNGYLEISGLSQGQYETVIQAEYNSTGVTDMYSSNSTNMTINITIDSGSNPEYPPVGE